MGKRDVAGRAVLALPLLAVALPATVLAARVPVMLLRGASLDSSGVANNVQPAALKPQPIHRPASTLSAAAADLPPDVVPDAAGITTRPEVDPVSAALATVMLLGYEAAVAAALANAAAAASASVSLPQAFTLGIDSTIEDAAATRDAALPAAAAAAAVASPRPSLASHADLGPALLQRLQAAQLVLSTNEQLRNQLYDSDSGDGDEYVGTPDDESLRLAARLLERLDGDDAATATAAAAADSTATLSIREMTLTEFMEVGSADFGGVDEYGDDDDLYGMDDDASWAYDDDAASAYDDATGHDADVAASAYGDSGDNGDSYDSNEDEDEEDGNISFVYDNEDLYDTDADGDYAISPAVDGADDAARVEALDEAADAVAAFLAATTAAAVTAAEGASALRSDASTVGVAGAGRDYSPFSSSRHLLGSDADSKDRKGDADDSDKSKPKGDKDDKRKHDKDEKRKREKDEKDEKRKEREREFEDRPKPEPKPANVWIPGVVHVQTDGDGNTKVNVGPLGSVVKVRSESSQDGEGSSQVNVGPLGSIVKVRSAEAPQSRSNAATTTATTTTTTTVVDDADTIPAAITFATTGSGPADEFSAFRSANHPATTTSVAASALATDGSKPATALSSGIVSAFKPEIKASAGEIQQASQPDDQAAGDSEMMQQSRGKDGRAKPKAKYVSVGPGGIISRSISGQHGSLTSVGLGAVQVAKLK